MSHIKTIYGTYNIIPLPNCIKAISQHSTHAVIINTDSTAYNTGAKHIIESIESDYENTILNQTPC